MANPLEVHPSGPFVQAGFLCDRVMTEQDGVNSYVRVVDRFQKVILQPNAPAEPHRAAFTIVILIRAGDAVGPFDVEVQMQQPSGQRSEPQIMTVHLTPGARINLHIPTQIVFEEQGQYAVLVSIAGKLLAEIPFDVLQGYQTFGAPPAPPG